MDKEVINIGLTVTDDNKELPLLVDGLNADLNLGDSNEFVEVVSSDYNKLSNKPTLDGRVIQGEIKEQDPTVPSWSKEPEKPKYTPTEIGAVADEDLISLTAKEINDMWNAM